jgi:F0F1-type ATP synthase membrane subunit c/vacuolar-type H+-ATPase subunit K
MNVGIGIWNTYNMATGILGDLLSYIRLFALGIASAIMGFVFNSLAVEMSGSIPVLSAIIMVIILVIGHSINLFMSGLGAFVHPLRLTFVEFYKNAGYTGGGKKYIHSKIILTNQNINKLHYGTNCFSLHRYWVDGRVGRHRECLRCVDGGQCLVGAMKKNNEAFGNYLILSALPGTQGLYGFMGFFILSGYLVPDITWANAAAIFGAGLALGFVVIAVGHPSGAGLRQRHRGDRFRASGFWQHHDSGGISLSCMRSSPLPPPS